MVPVQFLGEEVLATAPPYPTGGGIRWRKPLLKAPGSLGEPASKPLNRSGLKLPWPRAARYA